ncbi:MAG TPA: glycosyltransferase family 39 protein [Fimbriimonadaceae bacterium]|nr:glycosyltransferase family 39 protein [Fimbriimonadaceae bacterium]
MLAAFKKPSTLIPLGLFLASFLLRLIGIGWGLPNDLHNQSYHPDETINYGVSQAIDVSKGQLVPNPHFYNYGTAYFVAENVAGKIVDAYGGGPSGQSAKDLWQSVGRTILAGRVVSALAGAGAVVVLWLILRRITTQFGALFGCLLVAVAPGFVVHSRFESVDVFATFWLALSALFALRILGARPDSMAEADRREPSDMRDALLAGAFAGISTGTKYTGVLVLLVLWIALGMTRRPKWWIAGLAGSAMAFVCFVATTPGFLFDSANFWTDFSSEMHHAATGHGMVFIGTSSGFLYHIVNLIVGVGGLLSLAGFLGLAYAAFRKHPWAIALLAFALVYYFVIGRAEVKFLRYTFPLLLPLAAGFGYAMGTARRRGGWGHLLVAGGFFAIAGIDFGGFAGAIKYSLFMSGEDPRDEAARYLMDVAKDGTVGFVKAPWFWSAPLIPDAGLNRGQLRQIYREMDQSEHPKVVQFRPPDGSMPIDWDPRLVTETKPDYIVFSSFEANDEDRLKDASGLDAATQADVDRYKAFIPELQKAYILKNVFGGQVPEIHDLMYIRPTLWVWKRKDPR